MDEIGRGTSTFDGLSLAWACAEHLSQKIGAYTLFATHYFELTQLPNVCTGIVNVHLDAIEQNGKLIFLHQVKMGAANKSYGLQVAALAGVPKGVIAAAKKRLKQLEKQQSEMVSPEQTDLFNLACDDIEAETVSEEPVQSPALAALLALNPDELSPREALEALYRLQELVSAG
jgi:DNA mismatch repair protein MutS